jgi:hypothetical protein
MKLRYKLQEHQDAQRLSELADSENPNELESEIALCRLMLEKAYNTGDLSLAKGLANTIAKLSQTSEVAKYRHGELLSRATVISLANKMVEALTLSIRDKFSGWEQSLGEVHKDLLTIVCEARNEDEDASN